MNTHDKRAGILTTVTEYIHQTHQFPSGTEIRKATRISKDACKKHCDELVSSKQLYRVFEGKGNPTIYVPYDMMQSLLRSQKKPR